MADETSGRSRWIGRVLRDRWRIDARLARGGVGTVFAATHRKNGNRVAIKILHPQFSRDNDTRSRFLQEGYAANQVNHPGVVRILDDDTTEEGVAFLVMELLEGELLERRRQRLGGKLPLEEVYAVADQLLDVLAAAHEKGIVHRDIKPDNLFLTNDGRLKVLDFGFAQMKTGFRTEQTATGFLLGTPGFMSPEQAVGARGQVDAKTDIWAVGATLFTLLSGLPVHEAESAAEMLVAAANYPARSLGTVAKGLPKKLVEIVDRALAFDKRARWPSARAMKTALADVPGRLGRLAGDGAAHGQEAPSFDGRTVMAPAPHIEELDDADLREASWQTDPRKVIAPAEVVPAASPGGGGAPVLRAPLAHPAEDEGATIARPTPHDAFRPVHHSLPPPRASHHSLPPPRASHHSLPPPRASQHSVHPAETEGGTRIMDSGPSLGGAGATGPYAAIPVAPGSQPHGVGPRASMPGTPLAFGVGRHDPRLSRPDEMPSGPAADLMFVAGPARPAPERPAERPRVLLFVGVAIVSMLIVVVTGLLVIAASD